MQEFKDYCEWCKKYHLNKNKYENLYLYTHKNDMGFIFQEFAIAKENGALSENQIRAVEGV